MDQVQPITEGINPEQEMPALTQSGAKGEDQKKAQNIMEKAEASWKRFRRDLYMGLGIIAGFFALAVIASTFYPFYARETYVVPTMILAVVLCLVMVFYQVNGTLPPEKS